MAEKSPSTESTNKQYSEFKISKKEKAFVSAANLSTNSFVKTKTVSESYQRGYTFEGNIDAEKGLHDDYNRFGWAAVAANMYFKAGWAKNGAKTFSSEDGVFSYMFDSIAHNSICCEPEAGLAWLFCGNAVAETFTGNLKKAFYVNTTVRDTGCLHDVTTANNALSYYIKCIGGSDKAYNEFTNVSPSNYGYDCLSVIDKKLREGYTAGIGVAAGRKSSFLMGDALTLTVVGFTYNEKFKGKPGYYTGLIVADSDDDRGADWDNPGKCPDVYKVLSIKWAKNVGTYYFTEKNTRYSFENYGKTCSYYRYIIDFCLLAPNTTVTESAPLSVTADLSAPLETLTLTTAGFAETHRNVVVKEGEALDISGDEAYSTTVQAGGELQSGAASYAQDTLIEKGGLWNLTLDAAAEAASIAGTAVLDETSTLTQAAIQSGAAVTLHDEATLADSDVWGENEIKVYGGTVSGTVFHSAGSHLLLDGTEFDGFSQSNVFNGATQTLTQYTYSDGDAFNGGTQNVTGGNAYRTVLQADAVQYVEKGYATDTVIGAGAKAIVTNNGCTRDVVVEAGGTLEMNGGFIDGGTVSYGGKAFFSDKTYLSNTLIVEGTLEASGTLSGTSCSLQGESPTILLDLSQRSADDDFIVNDISKFENIAFAISLDSAKKLNTYKIAGQGAEAFFETVTVSVNNGDFYEEMLPNMSVSYGRYEVNLYVDSDALYFSTTSYLAEELAKQVVSGEGATLYTLSQQFQGGDFDEKFQESFALSMEYNGIYSLTGDFGAMNGKVEVYDGKKKIASGKIKAGELSLKPLLLKKESQAKYTIVVTNTDKGKTACDYTVGFGESEVFDKAYTGDDWDDLKWMGTDGNVIKMGEIAASGELFTDWVGYGDTIDYTEISFDTATRLVMDISASDSVKYTICSLQSKTKQGGSVTYSLKTLQSKTVKAGQKTSTKELLLAAGTYYIGVQSTNAAKGGNAEYTLSVNDNTVFYPYSDNSDDTWQLAAESQTEALVSGDTIIDWVGYGDSVDYLKFAMEEAGQLSLSFDESTDNAIRKKQLKISCVDSEGKKVSLNAFDGETVTSKKTLAAGEYYVKFASADSKKYDTEYMVSFATLA